MVGGEQVLGLARSDVPGGTDWRGVVDRPFEPYLQALAERGQFRPRAEAEEDPSWKQVIPYVLLRDGERIFLMRRTRAGGDERLHDRYTIGVGGHVNPEDADIIGGLRREWGGDRGRLRARIPADRRSERRRQRGRRGPSGPGIQRRASGRPVEIRETREARGSVRSVDDVRRSRTGSKPGARCCSTSRRRGG